MATIANRFAQSTLSASSASHDHANQPLSPGAMIDDLSASMAQREHETPIGATEAPLRVHVERVVREYFATLGDETPTDLYELVLKQVERPLLTVVLEQTRGNQTKCAQILGLNRGTLRKKMKMYDLM